VDRVRKRRVWIELGGGQNGRYGNFPSAPSAVISLERRAQREIPSGADSPEVFEFQNVPIFIDLEDAAGIGNQDSHITRFIGVVLCRGEIKLLLQDRMNLVECFEDMATRSEVEIARVLVDDAFENFLVHGIAYKTKVSILEAKNFLASDFILG
jgi:hypothetical protein